MCCIARYSYYATASLAPHFLSTSLRAALFEGGLRPHRYCLPILKHEDDRKALLRAIASNSPKFFAGTDSAPHAKGSKECGCGAAGSFTAHAPLELYAKAFVEAKRLRTTEEEASSTATGGGALSTGGGDNFQVPDMTLLVPFMCESGARFYGLEPNATRAGAGGGTAVELRREEWRVPDSYSFGKDAQVVPIMAGEVLPWKAVTTS